MKLEEQVASLELCKRLKELGTEQKQRAFYWVHISEPEWVLWYWKECVLHKENAYQFRNALDHEEYIAAFTVAELGAMLPTDYGTQVISCGNEREWFAIYDEGDGLKDMEPEIFALTEADCRAKMLIHLLEKGR